VELFEQIRREYEHGVGTIKGVARQFGVHRRLVRDAIASAVPPRRKAAPQRRPRLGAAVAFIDEILQADRKAPRKQRHTATPDLGATAPGDAGNGGGGVARYVGSCTSGSGNWG
jgi:hypothetical protein